jgi:SagB-type dehydrogenase family enzyme
MRAVLQRLGGRPCGHAELSAIAQEHDGHADALTAFLDALRAGGWLMTTVCYQGQPGYTIRPVHNPPPVPDTARSDLVLSRFTVLHREGEDFVAESPLAWAQVQVHAPALAGLLGALTGLVAPVAGPAPTPPGLARRLLRDLHWAGLAVSVLNEEDTEARLRQWMPHELWFHQRSRMGNGGHGGEGFGRNMWSKGTFEPVPPQRAPGPGPAIDLYRPDLDARRDSDPAFAAVLEDRHSTRVHDDAAPLTADQLGEFLYRSARDREVVTLNDVEYVSRPYPSGGSSYELELYPVVRNVSGLDAGMYHYDPKTHQLRLVRNPGPEVDQMLRAAANTAMVRSLPQVLIVVSARFGRVMLNYQQMPYALILRHVGVLYQTMYLVATAMGLAACGLGGGDAMAFTRATGLDYTTESSVGEFILGSRPADDRQR